MLYFVNALSKLNIIFSNLRKRRLGNMADNDTEVAPSAVLNTEADNAEVQGPDSSNIENNNTSIEQQPKDEPKSTDTNEVKIDKSKRTAKILLIIVNVCTLICSIILFVVGVIMTAKHANIHKEWEAGEGFLNASIICIVISLVLALVGSMGKSNSFKFIFFY